MRFFCSSGVVDDAVHADSVECVVLPVEGLVAGADAGVADEVSGAGCRVHNLNCLVVDALRNGEALVLVRTSETR